AAIDAAFPGDIIDGFQAGDAEVFLTKSLTLRNGMFDLGQVNHRLLRITGTPGIPTVLQSVVFRHEAWALGESSAGHGFIVSGTAQELRIDECRFEAVTGRDVNWATIEAGMFMVDVAVDRLWIRESSFVATDLDDNVPACDDFMYEYNGYPGISCLRAVARETILEACHLRAGNGVGLSVDCQQIAECLRYGGRMGYDAGDGGTALHLTCARGALIGTTYQDAPGGAITGSCPPYTFRPGRPGMSLVSGSVTRTDRHLTASGSPTVGGNLLVSCPLGPGEAGVFVIGIDWQFVPTAFGTLFTTPLDAFALPGGSASVSLSIPSNPSLRTLPLVTQAVFLRPSFRVGNPSGVTIR